jgi:uncharacterized protein YbjT (DUF2867 family)
MTSSLLITGGTGLLGSRVMPLLQDAGRELRVLSRRSPVSGDGIEYVTGDLLAGQGIEPALDGVQTILHLAGSTKGDAEATRNLVQVAARARVQHLVYISVVGADRVTLSWFRSKLGAEQAVIDSGLPWTILRAAQFNDLVLKTLRTMTKLPVVPVPGGLRFQPVDSRDVASRLVDLTLAEPAGRVPDLVGPAVYDMGELVRGYLEAVGKRRLLVPIRMPGKAGRAYRAGENLTVTGATVGERTWEDFLAERLASNSGHRTTSPVAT